MKLICITLKNLHNALNIKVEFNHPISLLIGVNGSGKTSVLNAVEWLLRADMQRLVHCQFDLISLDFEHDRLLHKLQVARTASDLVLSLSADREYDPITVDLRNLLVGDDDDSDEISELSPEPNERPLFDYLKSLPRLTVVQLDRTITAAVDERSYFTERARPPHRRLRSNQSPIAYVQSLTAKRFADYRTRAIQNENKLRAQLIASSLKIPRTKSLTLDTALNANQLDALEGKVSRLLSNSARGNDSSKDVKEFFDAYRLLLNPDASPEEIGDRVLFFALQYKQVEAIAQSFDEFERSNAEAFRQLQLYLDTVNNFLQDSNKLLGFDEGSGRLGFRYRSGDRASSRKWRSLEGLSSGEKQVLILLSLLAFSTSPDGLFLVDEPELSLHPKWQSELMDAFAALLPNGSQMLLATHSPDLVGRYRDQCTRIQEIR